MSTLDYPRLRPLKGERIEHRGSSFVALEDPVAAFTGQVMIPDPGFDLIVRRFDGRSSFAQIQADILAESGQRIAIDEIEALAEKLDRGLVLDGPTFARYRGDYAQLASRPAAMAGRSYPADPVTLREMLDSLFQGRRRPVSSDRIRAILCPHIDFGRGGSTYASAYSELADRSDADVFVILGVAHKPCRHRFAMTRKDFETPLGTARTDRAIVDRIAELAGPELFEDELAHRDEHSIEFQAVFLRYLLGGRRDFTIVPILVSSFHDLMRAGVEPIDDPEVSRMVTALRQAEAESGKKVAYIGGIDLCHVGPEFGDKSPVDDSVLETVRAFDADMLDRAIHLDPRRLVRPRLGREQPMAGLWPGRHLHDAPRHRPRPRPMDSVRPGDQPIKDLLRDFRQRRLRHRAIMTIDFRAEVARYDREATIGTMPGPRHRLRYRVLGDGPPLILAPGLASTYRGYAPTLLRLAERFQTVQFDYPGEHRDDLADLSTIGHAELVDDLFRLTDHLGFDQPGLFGLSFGSTLTLAALHRDPARFGKAVLQGGFANRRLRWPERMALRIGRRFRGPLSGLPFHERGLSRRNRTTFPAQAVDLWDYYVEENGLTTISGLTHRIDILQRLDLFPILPSIPTPILLIHGTADQIVPLDRYHELARVLPDVRGVLMPGVGHQPHFTHPEELARLVGDFLATG